MHVAAGRIYLYCSATGYFHQGSDEHDIAENQTLIMNFSLLPLPLENSVICGFVIDKNNNQPIQGAWVDVSWKNASGQYYGNSTSTNANGFYSLHVAAGSILLQVGANGYYTRNTPWQPIGSYETLWLNISLSTTPPHPPVLGTPTPANNSIKNPDHLNWSIPIHDPDGYAIFWTIQCSNGQYISRYDDANGTKTLTLYDLSYSTTYTIQVSAANRYTSQDAWYQFTTGNGTSLTITITRPLNDSFYFKDHRYPLKGRTFIYGRINITANASADSGVVKVEFYIDGKLKKTDNAAPYQYLWNPFIQVKGFSLKHNITVIATDTNGQTASAHIIVSKWRFHVLPWVLLGSKLIHSIVKNHGSGEHF